MANTAQQRQRPPKWLLIVGNIRRPLDDISDDERPAMGSIEKPFFQ
jgi:hypothetical protein